MTARVIALTGAIGSGKSTVLTIAGQQPGVVTISADTLVHQILADSTHPVVQAIGAYFGIDILGPHGVDRQKLSQRVFNDEAARRYLESVLHPAVRTRMVQQIAAAMDHASAIVVEVPLLFETGMHTMFPETWAVLLDAEQRSARVQKRDGVSHEAFMARNQLQVDDATRKALATHLIHNHGDAKDLQEQVLRLLAPN